MDNQNSKDLSSEQSCDDFYRDELSKPLEDIKQDIFFRADNFRNEEWYHEFSMFMAIGICKPKEEHISLVQKALKIMGHDSCVSKKDGVSCLVYKYEEDAR
jgi:hypothetical protein